MIRFGVHCSLRDGLTGSLEEAKAKGCEAMQIFTRSPRMWKMKPPAAKAVADFIKLRKIYNIHPLVVHIPYLPNLATSKPELYRLSLQALIDDLRLAEKLEADYLVIHPGSYSDGSTLEEGIKKIVSALNVAFDEAPGKSYILLETVAGGGRRIGSSFEEIRKMIDGVKDKKRIGVCLDTAHSFAAGYDLSTPSGIDKAMKAFESIIGFKYLKAMHFNDSLVPFNSRKDRHQHIGKGYIGEKGFRYIIKKLKDKVEAGILETPKEPESADKRNLKLLYKWRNNKH
ncbi:MAG: deoxyribonuclease IV [Elusimicrobiota bacterium]